MQETIYYVICETIDEEGDVQDWFECFSSDDCSVAIHWAENHVLDYVASEDEQLTVVAVDGPLYQGYYDGDVMWCSQ